VGETRPAACVIAGLGNPGKKYEMTRHTFGELLVRAIAAKRGWAFKAENRFQALVARGFIEDQPVFLMIPTTYMNESGRAVRALLDFYKLSAAELVVVCDDIALDFGTMRLRKEGSPGGHNGLKSVELHLGTQNYMRLRMGIGRGMSEQPLVDWVLDPFSSEEITALPPLLEKGAEALKLLVSELARGPVETAMNRVSLFFQPQKQRKSNALKAQEQVKSGEQKNESTKAQPLRRDVCDQGDAK
jgi:PTH1 family peptidyl-tRNA hydrolase